MCLYDHFSLLHVGLATGFHEGRGFRTVEQGGILRRFTECNEGLMIVLRGGNKIPIVMWGRGEGNFHG